MTASERTEEPELLAQWLGLLRRRRAWAFSVFAVVLAVAVVVLVAARPVYIAEARLRLGEPPPMSGVSPNAGILSFFQLGGDAFSNDLELFGSRTLAEDVVMELALTVQLDAPRGVYRDHVLGSLSTSRETSRETFRVRWSEPTRVTIDRVAPSDSALGTFDTFTPVRLGGVSVAFRPQAADGPDVVEIRTRPFGEAVRATSGTLSLTRPRREANVLEVSFSNQDPGLAEAVVESAVARFLSMRSELLERESAETVDSLRTVAEATRAELGAAEAAVETMQRESGLVAPDAQSDALIERYEGVMGQLEATRAELAALDQQLDRVSTTTSRIEAWTTLVAHPRFLANQTMGEILGRLTDLQARSTELSARRASGSRDLLTLEQQIQELDGSLRTIATEFRAALAGQVVNLTERVSTMDATLARLPAQVLELGRLQRTARLLSELLLITEQRLRQEEIRQALTFSNVQVIDAPAVQYRPIWPRPKVGLVVGVILALASALMSVVVVERADAAVRTESDVGRTGAAPVVALLISEKGVVRATQGDLAALRHTLAPDGGGVLASVSGGDDAELVVQAFVSSGIDMPLCGAVIDSFGSAVEAVQGGRPVVLVARVGRTRRADIARAVRNIEAAGGSIRGTLIVAGSVGEAKALWA